jgi:F0F1-type ATP synthase epsilon subunit
MHQKNISLEIISSSKNEIINVLWVEIESPTGSFVVGPDHIPLVSIMKKRGILTYKQNNGEEVEQEVNGGIFEIYNNKAFAILT